MAVKRHLLSFELLSVDDELDFVAVAVYPYGYLLSLVAVKIPVRKYVKNRLFGPP